MSHAPLFCLALLLGRNPQSAQLSTPLRAGRIPVHQPADLPAHAYAIAGKPSEAAQHYEAALALATQVEQALHGDLERYDVRDTAVLEKLHTTLYVTAMIRKDFVAAGRHLEVVRGLQGTATDRLMTGLFTDPLIQAMETPRADLHAAYRRKLSQRLEELPFKDVRGFLERMLKGHQAASKEQILGGLAAALDPQVQEGKLTEEEAGALLESAMRLHVTLPMRADITACLSALFEAHKADRAATPARNPLGTATIHAKGPYFGQIPPGETPVPFAPEILKAVSPWVSNIAFSPDGSECFIGVGSPDYSRGDMYVATCVNGAWTPLKEPTFLAGFDGSGEPAYLKDRRTLLFTGRKGEGSMDLWTTTRTASGWSAPIPLPAPINTEANEFRGSFTDDGIFYFGSGRASAGSNQVFKAGRNAAGAWAVEKLDASINASPYEGDPCVAPDGRWMVTYSARPGGHGRVDLYVCFADGKGGWGRPINMGPGFNTADEEWGACLSTDGKYLFFTRHSPRGEQLYWVSVAAVDRLRP